jgi:hypothetical protein
MFDIATSRRALPGQLFNSTQFPGSLWLLAKNRSVDGKRGVRDCIEVDNQFALAA